MPPRILAFAAFALLASGCAEENPHYPTSAGSQGRHGRGANSDTAQRFQGQSEITDTDVKDAKQSKATQEP